MCYLADHSDHANGEFLQIPSFLPPLPPSQASLLRTILVYHSTAPVGTRQRPSKHRLPPSPLFPVTSELSCRAIQAKGEGVILLSVYLYRIYPVVVALNTHATPVADIPLLRRVDLAVGVERDLCNLLMCVHPHLQCYSTIIHLQNCSFDPEMAM